MKKFVTLFALVAFFVAAGPTAAQTFGFGAHAGVSIPTGDYADAASTGFSGGLDLSYPLLMVTPGLNWYTSADVIAHSAEDELVGADGGFLLVPIMTGLQFEFPAGGIRPFVNGQVGVVLHRGPDFDGGVLGTAESELGTDFGFVLGGGVRLGQNFYVGAKYYPLDVSFQYENAEDEPEWDANFFDIFVGFGVF